MIRYLKISKKILKEFKRKNEKQDFGSLFNKNGKFKLKASQIVAETLEHVGYEFNEETKKFDKKL